MNEPLRLGLVSKQDACPGWCNSHIPGDNGSVMHISSCWTADRSAGGEVENGATSVSLERRDQGALLGMTVMRLDGADGPMTALEALHLATVLQVSAISALQDHEGNR